MAKKLELYLEDGGDSKYEFNKLEYKIKQIYDEVYNGKVDK